MKPFILFAAVPVFAVAALAAAPAHAKGVSINLDFIFGGHREVCAPPPVVVVKRPVVCAPPAPVVVERVVYVERPVERVVCEKPVPVCHPVVVVERRPEPVVVRRVQVVESRRDCRDYRGHGRDSHSHSVEVRGEGRYARW